VIAVAAAGRGAHVLVVDRDAFAARRVADELRGTALTADLSDSAQADVVAAAAGRDVDVVVSCAGGWSPTGGNFPDSAMQDWDAVLTLNLRTPMRLLQLLRPALARSRIGAAVSISSSAGRGLDAYASPEYAVAKAGLIRLTTSLADWSERFGVRVSAVVPGWIGLPRAVQQVRALPEGERPPLVPPGDIADQVLELVDDPTAGGRVVVMNPGVPARALVHPDT
jgi:3-oxoacyl-[acyl-carrier protein] reductase